MHLLPNLKSKMSSDNPIRPCQHVRWNRQADLFSCSQVYDELELLWLLHRQVAWLCAFQDFIDVGGGAVVPFDKLNAVAHQPASLDELRPGIDHRASRFCRQLEDGGPLRIEYGA